MDINSYRSWLDCISPDDGLVWLNGQSNPLGTVTIDGTIDKVVIKWDPAQQPGTDVFIQKDIYVPEGITTFAISEWPTVPEPSMLALGGISLIGMLTLRRKSH